MASTTPPITAITDFNAFIQTLLGPLAEIDQSFVNYQRNERGDVYDLGPASIVDLSDSQPVVLGPSRRAARRVGHLAGKLRRTPHAALTATCNTFRHPETHIFATIATHTFHSVLFAIMALVAISWTQLVVLALVYAYTTYLMYTGLYHIVS
jgi:hypothetical protein